MARSRFNPIPKPKREPKDKWATPDNNFSKFIRVRDCLYFSGNTNAGRCCTCGKPLMIYDADCGHFITRDVHSLRFCETNAHMQCKLCNWHRKGEQAKHQDYIEKVHGPEVLRVLQNERNLWEANVRRFDQGHINLQVISKYYLQKRKDLESGKIEVHELYEKYKYL